MNDRILSLKPIPFAEIKDQILDRVCEHCGVIIETVNFGKLALCSDPAFYTPCSNCTECEAALRAVLTDLILEKRGLKPFRPSTTAPSIAKYLTPSPLTRQQPTNTRTMSNPRILRNRRPKTIETPDLAPLAKAGQKAAADLRHLSKAAQVARQSIVAVANYPWPKEFGAKFPTP